MNDLKQRLMSRKLWLAVGSFITFVANKQYDQAMGVVMTYITLEGAGDVVTRYTGKAVTPTPLVTESQNDENDVDTSKVVTGNKPTGIPLFDEDVKE